MKRIFIVSAKRTPIGKFMGSLSSFSAAKMGAKVIKSIIDETKIDPKKIDTVIVGNVLSGGLKQGVGRQCAIGAGIPFEKTAYSINMVCGSGMKAVMNAYTDIALGMTSVIIAGGTESMSNAGFILQGSLRSGFKMGNMQAVDHMVNDGLTDAFGEYHMGITAENLAEKLSITREEQDNFSFQSQQKAISAVDSDKFKKEIVPMEIIELNEAFAAQSLGVIKSLCKEHNVSYEWMEKRTNIHGGAIALGHPIGASGNRILVSLIHELKMYNKNIGLASLCIGGGMGTAIIVKAVK